MFATLADNAEDTVNNSLEFVPMILSSAKVLFAQPSRMLHNQKIKIARYRDLPAASDIDRNQAIYMIIKAVNDRI